MTRLMGGDSSFFSSPCLLCRYLYSHRYLKSIREYRCSTHYSVSAPIQYYRTSRPTAINEWAFTASRFKFDFRITHRHYGPLKPLLPVFVIFLWCIFECNAIISWPVLIVAICVFCVFTGNLHFLHICSQSVILFHCCWCCLPWCTLCNWYHSMVN